MSMQVPSEFVPISDEQALLDANYIRGGIMSVADITARNNINVERRKLGLLVYVQSTQLIYILKNGVTNSDWETYIYSVGVYSSGFSGSSATFIHNLGFMPNVQLINASGDLLIGKITHNSSNSLTVTFNKSYTGSGYLS